KPGGAIARRGRRAHVAPPRAMRPERIPRRYRRVVEQFVSGNDVRLLRNGGESFRAMLEAINQAEGAVLVEMYWIACDTVGRSFAEALLKARGRGVQAAVMYDSVGSWDAEEEMFDELSRAGVGVLEFNPLAPWKQRFRLARLTARDHRKIL